MNIPEAVIEQTAERLYATYCEAVGGKAHDGNSLPAWPAFRADPSKIKQSTAWIEVARRAERMARVPVAPVSPVAASVSNNAAAQAIVDEINNKTPRAEMLRLIRGMAGWLVLHSPDGAPSRRFRIADLLSYSDAQDGSLIFVLRDQPVVDTWQIPHAEAKSSAVRWAALDVIDQIVHHDEIARFSASCR